MPLTPAVSSPAAERQARISACCVHTEEYGTRSSMLVCDPTASTDLPRVWSAAGPPCTHQLLSVAFDP
jgi:hypothetical protein